MTEAETAITAINDAVEDLKGAQQSLNAAAKLLIDANLGARAQNALTHSRELGEKKKQLEQLVKNIDAKQAD